MKQEVGISYGRLLQGSQKSSSEFPGAPGKGKHDGYRVLISMCFGYPLLHTAASKA